MIARLSVVSSRNILLFYAVYVSLIEMTQFEDITMRKLICRVLFQNKINVHSELRFLLTLAWYVDKNTMEYFMLIMRINY